MLAVTVGIFKVMELLDMKEMVDIGIGVVVSRYQLNMQLKFYNEMELGMRYGAGGLNLIRGVNGEIL